MHQAVTHLDRDQTQGNQEQIRQDEGEVDAKHQNRLWLRDIKNVWARLNVLHHQNTDRDGRHRIARNSENQGRDPGTPQRRIVGTRSIRQAFFGTFSISFRVF